MTKNTPVPPAPHPFTASDVDTILAMILAEDLAGCAARLERARDLVAAAMRIHPVLGGRAALRWAVAEIDRVLGLAGGER